MKSVSYEAGSGSRLNSLGRLVHDYGLILWKTIGRSIGADLKASIMIWRSWTRNFWEDFFLMLS